MFRNRTNSQKPTDDFYANFRASYPNVSAQQRSEDVPAPTTTLAEALDVVASHSRPYAHTDDMKDHDQDPTPRGAADHFRFTPSIMDPNSFAFANFANQPPGYYTPTPGGTNTLYHNQAGDLHTPGFGFGLGTPLSLPTSESGLHAGQPPHAFHQSQGMAPHVFQNPNPFSMDAHESFAPHHFTHQHSTFDQLESSQDVSQLDEMPVDVDMHERSPIAGFEAQNFAHNMGPPLMPQQPMEHFRYHVTLHAPTAMIKSADEIPVTYLNKGQAYTLSIVDTGQQQIPPPGTRYRTFVRISFEDEQQRQRPAACWQLWKEGRGTNEAHHRGGRLQAVEFVDPTQVTGGDSSGKPRIVLESASFDGFSVSWCPAPGAGAECSVAVRFNFLSTDFSHSKGVKGIPVRLCAKTTLLADQQDPISAPDPQAEICYCKVKLFRDHGAERKLSNDVAHVKKTIEKLKQQIAQADAGMKDFGKRKRTGSTVKGPSASSGPGKVPKHKRTWSMSSASDTGNRMSGDEDLKFKLQTLNDMFSSQRANSVMYLRGENGDDPDAHPVHLPGQPPDLTKIETGDSAMWDGQSPKTGGSNSLVSPTPSQQSIQSGSRRESGFQQPTPFNPPSRVNSNEWRSNPQTATGDLQPGLTRSVSLSSEPVKVQKSQTGSLPDWIEAVGVDFSYQPPPERIVKPAACFYIKPELQDRRPDDHYYRAVYLMQRTLKDFVNSIALKSGVEPTRVVRTLRINAKGLSVLLDDDMVRELPEGQDMIAEFFEVRQQSPMKREWDAGPTDIQVDGDIGILENVTSNGYELRLLY